MKKRTVILLILLTLPPLAVHRYRVRQSEKRFDLVKNYLLRDSGEHFDTERELMSLSFISLGLLRRYRNESLPKEELTLLSKRCAEQALQYLPFLHEKPRWRGQGLLLSHLNITLGTYRVISGDNLYADLQREISLYLAEEISSAPYHTMKSYPEMSDRWPADNSVILASLFLYDQTSGTAVSKEPIAGWLKTMKSSGTAESGLFKSEMTNCESYSEIPRGGPLSLMTIYMDIFAPAEAEKLWKSYKREMKIPLLFFAGFREYPKNSGESEDYDSGPIILGMGAAATGLALPAAVIMEDRITAAQISNALLVMNIFIALSKDPLLSFERKSITAESILFLADE